MEKIVRQWHKYTGHKIAIAVIGILLSVVLHELFHVWMHWGDITSIGFFQGGSIAEIIVIKHTGDDIEGEELAAYLITLLTMLVTLITLYKISDSTDQRSAQQIIFGDGKDAPNIKSAEFLKLANKADIIPSGATKSKKARKK